ncbi:MAG TPA: TlpA family protein disulfide reductase [Dehalococcoidia bacterium]|nr:TlpA family protein disulfide reductase [Dehalococcoidia bacterium]
MKVMSGEGRGGIVSLALSVTIIGLLLLAGCGLAPAPEVGYPAPDFTLTDLDGNTVRLRDLRGNVVFLNFWATWCPPCRAEMPAMEGLYQEYKNRDVVIIGVDLLEYWSNVEYFVEVNGYSWTFVIDTDGQVAMDYMVTGIPSSFFIDKDGIIRALQVGPMSRFTMEAKLAEAME